MASQQQEGHLRYTLCDQALQSADLRLHLLYAS
jgi:hypothetical protein